MKRIVIWAPNYAPEMIGIPPLVTDAAEWLTSTGLDVDVVTTMPHYPERRIHDEYRGRLWAVERRGGVTVRRSWLYVQPQEGLLAKAAYEVTASTFALPSIAAARRRADAIVCVVPTLLAAVYVALLPTRARRVIWIQDLVLRAARAVSQRGAISAVLRGAAGLERLAVTRADRVVVCSPGFRQHFLDHGVDNRNIEVIYNWVDLDQIRPIPPDGSHARRTRFLYAGNLGYTQGFETLMEAARILGDSALVEVVGDGNASLEVRRLAANLGNVRVRQPVCSAYFPELLASHDVHLVIQRRVAAGANLPSKIASYLASGRPVVASIDSRTPAADLLRASGGALIVEPEDPVALAEAMRVLQKNPIMRREMGRRARAFAEIHFDKRMALAQLEQAIIG